MATAKRRRVTSSGAYRVTSSGAYRVTSTLDIIIEAIVKITSKVLNVKKSDKTANVRLYED